MLCGNNDKNILTTPNDLLHNTRDGVDTIVSIIINKISINSCSHIISTNNRCYEVSFLDLSRLPLYLREIYKDVDKYINTFIQLIPTHFNS